MAYIWTMLLSLPVLSSINLCSSSFVMVILYTSAEMIISVRRLMYDQLYQKNFIMSTGIFNSLLVIFHKLFLPGRGFYFSPLELEVIERFCGAALTMCFF